MSDIKVCYDEIYENEMTLEIIPFLSHCKESGYSRKGLFYSIYRAENMKGFVTLSHGFSEGMYKYREFIYYLVKSDFTVLIFEHRGHGRSVRSCEDETLIHIDSYTQYIEDLKSLTEEVVIPERQNKPAFLYGHSMGGCIAALFAERYPEYYSKIILSSPMLGIKMPYHIPHSLARFLSGIIRRMGKGCMGIPGMDNDEEAFEDSCSTSWVRWNYANKLRRDNILLRTYQPTFGWLNASLRASAEAVKNKRNNTKPTLLFISDNDSMVEEKKELEFAKGMQNTEVVKIKNTKHEILSSPADILQGYIDQILLFLNS